MDLSRALELVNQALAGTSQERLAKAIDVDSSVISRWRSGKTVPAGEGREKIFAWANQQLAAKEMQQNAEQPAAHSPHQNRHFRELHEKASAETRLWLAQFMLDTLEANMRDLREILTAPVRLDKDGKLLPGELPPSKTELTDQPETVGRVGRAVPAKKFGRRGGRD